MKKVILLIIILSFFLGTVILAQETELPKPGLTPDSPFYFLDTLGEKIGMFFTFGAEKKIKKAIKYAEEKLAEVKVMVEKNKTKALERATQKYQKFIGLANTKTTENKERGKNVEELATLIIEKTLKHQEILIEVFERVPGEAIEAIQKAIEVSGKGFEEAVQAVTGAKKEELQQKIEEIRIDCLRQGGYCSEECKERADIVYRGGVYLGGCPSSRLCCRPQKITCKDLCRDGKCQEMVCLAVGCPCSETPTTCPEDCKTDTGNCASENEFCGGIAGIKCCSDLTCQLEGDYPDASGKCVKKCAREGEHTSGPVSPAYVFDCCSGLKGFDTYPAGWAGGGLLCYNPNKGTPVCKAIGTRSEGWYYQSDELLKYEECGSVVKRDILKIDINKYLDINQEVSRVELVVSAENSPNEVDAFGFDVKFEGEAEYLSYSRGDLTNEFEFFDTNDLGDNTIRVGGFTTKGIVSKDASGNMVILKFEGQISSAKVINPVDDVADWIE